MTLKFTRNNAETNFCRRQEAEGFVSAVDRKPKASFLRFSAYCSA
jgi:hypothetical protein